MIAIRPDFVLFNYGENIQLFLTCNSELLPLNVDISTLSSWGTGFYLIFNERNSIFVQNMSIPLHPKKDGVIDPCILRIYCRFRLPFSRVEMLVVDLLLFAICFDIDFN